jgi:phosphoglycolate phosphatase
MEPIFHLAERAVWDGAADTYAPPTLATEGFIHCSSAAQVEATANRYYAGRRDLLLLTIDPVQIPSAIRWEPPVDPTRHSRFPHVYGPIPRRAITTTRALEPTADGTFALAPWLPPADTRRSAVIFDCDGVLFESRRANIGYYDAIRAALGLPPMDATWQHRVHFLASSQVLAEMFGPDPAAVARVRAVAAEIDYTPFFALMDPAEQLHDVLATLRTTHRLAMATNRGSTVMEIVRRFGLASYFDAALGVQDVARPKPHPDLLEAACARLQVAPVDAVYIGDAETDLIAARSAGLHFIAIGTAPWSASSVETLGELPAYLGRTRLTDRMRRS